MILSRFKLVSIIIAALAAGIILGAVVLALIGFPGDQSSKYSDNHNADEGVEADHDHGEQGDTYYTCPMHPSVISDSPGACPVCGMDLIKKTSTGGEMNPQELAALGRVAISPTQRVLANVQTSAVKSVFDLVDESGEKNNDAAAAGTTGPSDASQVRAVGVVAAGEEGLATVPSWLDGRVERLLVKKTGTAITRGQPIMEIYSPELLTAQNEFLLALKNAEAAPGSATASLVEPTRQRLLLLGMSKSQVETLEKTREPRQSVTMRAPNAGTVTSMLVRQGQYVQTGAPLFEVADLSNLRVEAELRAHALAEFDLGARAHITSDAWSDDALTGEVAFIYPTVQTDTRTVKVRIHLDKPSPKLKPGMFVTVAIDKRALSSSKTSAAAEHTNTSAENAQDDVLEPLLVPRSAVIRGGKVDYLYVEVSENLFEKRQVKIGGIKERYLIVLEGLKTGDLVATSGAFLLDSEVQLHTFGADEHVHEHHDGHEHADEHADHGEHQPEEMLTAEDVPAEGKEFKPPISVNQIPQDMWFCDMGGKAHWVQGEKRDGKCPLCGMFLVEYEHDPEHDHKPTDDKSHQKDDQGEKSTEDK